MLIMYDCLQRSSSRTSKHHCAEIELLLKRFRWNTSPMLMKKSEEKALRFLTMPLGKR